MSKIPKAHAFLDLSDYGRTPARWIANALKNTKATPIHVTLAFGIVGLFACYFILSRHFLLAGICLIIKSILDAADGELARVKATPSYSGRYLDSIFDIVLNFLIIVCICIITKSPILYGIAAFIGIQLQGTLYNYYYVILRNEYGGDTTSRINEKKIPIAFPNEKQTHVNILFHTFNILYRSFDQIIYYLDRSATRNQKFPSYFMTAVSALGLGSQLLIMAILMTVNLEQFILPFFIAFTLCIPVLIVIRRYINT